MSEEKQELEHVEGNPAVPSSELENESTTQEVKAEDTTKVETPETLDGTPLETADTAEIQAIEETPQKEKDESSAEEEAAPTFMQTEDEPVQSGISEKASERMSTETPGVDYSGTFRSLSRGDRVNGVVVHIDKEGVLVDVGTKSEGLIKPEELSSGSVDSLEDVVSVGEQIDVYVMESEDQNGNLILSKKRADFERAWERVEQAHQEGKVVTAMVTDRVKGGLQVDLGIRGFVPGSHVGSGKVKTLDRFVGQSLPLRVIEVDRERRKVVLSHRLAMEEERSKERDRTIATLKEGQTRDGIVRRLTDYGAFVDLGGIDGLLHISEMSWTRINHPSEVVKVGNKIQIMVLRVDLDAGRVSLGLRQILPDPWTGVQDRYRVGDIVKGTITRIFPFGAFVQLDDIEAIIPNTELSQKRVKRPEDVISTGETIEARIIDIRAEERRMSLSLRQLHEEKAAKEYDNYQSRSGFDGRMTLGDLVGDKLQGLVGKEPSDAKSRKKSKSKTEEAPAIESAEIEMAETAEPAEVVETAETAEVIEIEETAEVVETAETAEVVETEETAEVVETAETAEAVEIEETAEVETAVEAASTDEQAASAEVSEEAPEAEKD